MATDCCKLVGNLSLALEDCIISVNVSSRAEVIKECGGELLMGPSTGSVSITAYASNDFYIGCGGKAGVSISWVRRYDCENDEVHFIPSGKGASYVVGDVEGLASLLLGTGKSYTSFNANASSGPATIYTEVEQEDGYGLLYTGNPFSFSTEEPENLEFENFGVGEGTLYLQNFSLELNSSTLPVVTYSFMFSMQ